MAEEADELLRKFDYNISYMQHILYNIADAKLQFYPPPNKKNKRGHEHVACSDDDHNNNNAVGGNSSGSSTGPGRPKGNSAFDKGQQPASSSYRERPNTAEFTENAAVNIISHTGKYVSIHPYITQGLPEDSGDEKSAVINATRQLLDTQLAEEEILERSPLAQTLQNFRAEDPESRKRLAIESRFLQPVSPRKARDIRVTKLDVQYKGSGDYRTVHIADNTLVGTIRFPYDFKNGAKRLVDDYAKNRLMSNLNLRYTAPVSILPVVDSIPREKPAADSPTLKRLKGKEEIRRGICKGFALFSDHGRSFELSPLSVEEFLLGATERDLSDFFKVIVTFIVFNFKNVCLDAIQVIAEKQRPKDEEDSSSSSEEGADSASKPKLQLMFMAREGNMCDMNSVSFRDDFLYEFIAQADKPLFKSITFKDLIRGPISDRLNNHLTQAMRSMHRSLQPFLGTVRSFQSSAPASQMLSDLATFATGRNIIQEHLFTCTVPFALVERLSSTPMTMRSNKTISTMYNRWVNMLNKPKKVKKKKKDKKVTNKKRATRKDPKTPEIVTDSDE